MQEDKASKWLASELRKQQEENPLPYELGAWEAFEAKRAAITKKKTTYWLSGIAAALALLLVAGGLWISRETTESGNSQLSGQLALEKRPAENSEKAVQPTVKETEIAPSKELPPATSGRSEDKISPSTPASRSIDPDGSKSEEPVAPKLADQSPLKSTSTFSEAKATENPVSFAQPMREEIIQKPTEALIASNEKASEEMIPPTEKQQQAAVQAELPKDPQISDEEIKEILETKSSARIAMGLSPGFGSSQGSEQATTGSSLGLGVMVDMDITGKLVLGSGLAVNYLNQSSESQSYNYGGANALSAAVTETNEIAQVQVDIPLYVKYPVTRNGVVSVQAGFSNLITFSQGAEQQSSYTRQVAVMDGLSSNNSFALKSEAVTQSQDLSVPNQKFYPFATANLGVNILLYESKKTSYEVMPFYNYPLQEFSGYGEKLGMFGASFKVNFGAFDKK
jgi:hypothetical protein